MTSETMSEQNPENHTDHMWQIHMQTLMKRKRNMEIAQIIDKALFEWYSEQGRPLPQWKREKYNWWKEYLESLGLDPNNP